MELQSCPRACVLGPNGVDDLSKRDGCMACHRLLQQFICQHHTRYTAAESHSIAPALTLATAVLCDTNRWAWM